MTDYDKSLECLIEQMRAIESLMFELKELDRREELCENEDMYIRNLKSSFERS